MRTFFILASIFVAAQAVASSPMQVDGVPVSGQTDVVSISDIRDAIAAFKESDSRAPASLTIINKDEIHGYIPMHDLGWITVKRTICHEPDGSQHACWYAFGQGLPDFSVTLRCIQAAQQVYVFPLRTPDQPRRDDAHMRLLDSGARGQLADLLGLKEDWFEGLDDRMGPPEEPPNVGFVFLNGNDELVMFFIAG